MDQIVRQIKARDYSLGMAHGEATIQLNFFFFLAEGNVKKSADGKLQFRNAPPSARPKDLKEEGRVLINPVTGLPIVPGKPFVLLSGEN